MMTDPSEEKMLKQINRIKQSVKSMSRMTEDVVFLQKVDWDSASKDLNEVDLERLLKEVIKFEKSDCLKENEVNLDLHLNPEFLTNSHILEKLFHILINNALKYGQTSPLKIKATQEESTLHFKINNEGTPLNQDNKEHIFDLFFRGNNAQESEGIGIGLTIAKRIVDSLEGLISVESDAKNGTTFKVSIPESKKEEKKSAA